MESARVKGFDRPLTADEFHGHVGPNYRERGIFPHCDLCGEIVHSYGVNSPDAPSRFDHPDFPGGDPYDDCPLARRQLSRFRGIEPSTYCRESGKVLRESFFERNNLMLAYQFMHRLAGNGNLPIELFARIIERADRRRIWDYVNLPLRGVPYVLMTIAQFEAEQYKFHFGFNKPRGPAEIIWNNSRCATIVKYFSDSGRIFSSSSGLTTVSEDDFGIIAGTGRPLWVSERLFVGLRRCQGQGG